MEGYRENAKVDVEELPVRQPFRWHRLVTLTVPLAWLAFALGNDIGVLGLDVRPGVSVWALAMCISHSIAAYVWTARQIINEGRW